MLVLPKFNGQRILVRCLNPQSHWLPYVVGVLLAWQSSCVFSQQPFDDQVQPLASQQANPRATRRQAKIYRNKVVPNWINEHQFWYRTDLAGGDREFTWVDARTAVRKPAFDHAKVRQQLSPQTSTLPIDWLIYDQDGQLVTLGGKGKRYRLDPANSDLMEIEEGVGVDQPNSSSKSTAPFRRPLRTGAETSLTFINRMKTPVEILWINGSGGKTSYGKLAAGEIHHQHTFGGHRWEVVDSQGNSLGQVVANDSPTEATIDGTKFPEEPAPRRRGRRSRSAPDGSGLSPDGQWVALVQDNNIFVENRANGQKIQLSQDGEPSLSYGWLQWSPDSQTLVAFRVQPVQWQQVHLIQSSPPEGGRAVLRSNNYALPGDPFPSYEINLFRVAEQRQLKPEVDRFQHEWLTPNCRFSSDSRTLTYEQTDRGHGRFRLIEVDLQTGETKNLIDEKSDTFIWTTHAENRSLSRVNWLEQTEEIIYATEQNGWHQLLLLDSRTGSCVRELTPRGIVVRGIDRIDEENRQVWISACGRSGQDPYFVHFARVDLDTGNLVWLTEGDGNHTIDFSPSGEYLIDSYSRVDMGPVIELRRVDDGSMICELERADLSELESSGWRSPQVFVAKGRDGQTDIWGIISRPKDFDPSKKYPIIEDIYAGPQGSFVPKSFGVSHGHDALTSLGFIVVQIDGMGTANRSKAFHDVCWKNLKDGGFQDRILWIKAAATQFPEMDISRVGIYGTSAGGQNAAAAVLFHPEFYKVAVAACGCHDNRMDKASWNEQWMGYPVGPHYSECSNIDNAHRLQGQLLLIVGELDDNVPPESTLRFADALIRADKDFDLLVVPNSGHGMGGSYGERRMRDFFVTHLLGQTRTNHNQP